MKKEEDIVSQKQKRIDWEKEIKVEGLPILTMKEVDVELETSIKEQKEQEK